jgi:nitroreductase
LDVEILALPEKASPSFLHLILERRSVRRFTQRAVSGKLLKTIVKAGQRAPTSCGIQFYSFIEVSDRRKRRLINNLVSENQVLESAPIWVFVCCDVARPLKMFETLKIDCYLGEVTRLVHSLIDASLAAQNMVMAAESLGLGSVITIYHWKVLREVSELLHLPRNVLPLLLLCIGYPAEKPPLRPRWSTYMVLHKNRYRLPDQKTMLRNYGESNRSLVNMNYFKGDATSLAEHWQRKFLTKEMILREKKLRIELRKLGFLPKKM